MVVVHRQDSIVASECSRSEETIGSKGAKGEDATLVCLDNGGLDNLLLLFAQETTIASVGVECQDCNLGAHDAEVLLHRAIHLADALHDKLLCECLRNARHGDMYCCKTYAHKLRGHNHQRCAVKLLSQKLGVASVVELGALNHLLVDRCCYKGVDSTIFKVVDSLAKRDSRSLATHL